MAAVKKKASAETLLKRRRSRRNVNRLFDSSFSGQDESQSVKNVQNVSGTGVAEFNFLTEAYDSGLC